jgi:polar amino acid transport system substrate-binding protein
MVIFLCLGLLTRGPQVGADPLLVSTSYNNLLSNRENTGMLDRIVLEAFDRIDVEAEIVFSETEQSLVDVNGGLLDVEMNRIEGMEAAFPNLVRVPEPNMVMRFVAFASREIRIDGWQSIRPLYIGIVHGWKILESNTEGFPGVVLVPTEVELFNMLHKDRIDIALYAQLTGYAALSELGYNEIFHLEPPLATREMYMYVHQSHAEIVDKLAEALREMKLDGTYHSIVAETAGSSAPEMPAASAAGGTGDD